ncbi:hypothetical protein N431DRAFT_546260 [Stipitochalara longipes BDJ]|nr:hypothetical protein N431DRAFT_546260 [Stipitochalara longipes BDJ]
MADAQEPELVSQTNLAKTLVPLEMAEEDQAKHPRVRSKKPKVRTGCKTWYVVFPGTLFLSIRRVKCDERKPSCLRCDKFGISCDGYEVHTSPVVLRGRNLSPLLPRNVGNLSILTPSPAARFESQEEYQYFLHYRSETSIDISGAMPEDVWNQVIPRAAESAPALRNLTLAVSAMDKARHSSSPASHSQYAVEKYGKALRGIRDLIAARIDQEAVRISLIASLLIFCFENLQGETQSAIRHIKSALNFMRTHLTAIVRYVPKRHSVSSLNGFEDEISILFARIDSMFVVTDFMAGKRLVKVEFIDGNINMPPVFRNIGQVRNYLQEWQFRGYPYLPRLKEIYSGKDESTDPLLRGPPDYFEKTMKYAQEWFDRCKPLLAKKDPKSREWLKYAILHTHGLICVLAAKRAYLGNGSDTPGLFEPESLSMVEFCSQIVQNQYYRRTFAFDIGPIEGLFVVCVTCRKKEICEEALRILRLAKGRTEMLADAGIYAARCEAILQMRFSIV